MGIFIISIFGCIPIILWNVVELSVCPSLLHFRNYSLHSMWWFWVYLAYCLPSPNHHSHDGRDQIKLTNQSTPLNHIKLANQNNPSSCLRDGSEMITGSKSSDLEFSLRLLLELSEETDAFYRNCWPMRMWSVFLEAISLALQIECLC